MKTKYKYLKIIKNFKFLKIKSLYIYNIILKFKFFNKG